MSSKRRRRLQIREHAQWRAAGMPTEAEKVLRILDELRKADGRPPNKNPEPTFPDADL